MAPAEELQKAYSQLSALQQNISQITILLFDKGSVCVCVFVCACVCAFWLFGCGMILNDSRVVRSDFA